MKKAFTYLFVAAVMLFTSCQKESNQYLTLGKGTRERWFEPIPYGMVYVERGSYNMGSNDDEIYSHVPTRTVSNESFWIDDTEITNNEYRQFVYWVRDKKARELLGQTYTDFIITEDKYQPNLCHLVRLVFRILSFKKNKLKK